MRALNLAPADEHRRAQRHATTALISGFAATVCLQRMHSKSGDRMPDFAN